MLAALIQIMIAPLADAAVTRRRPAALPGRAVRLTPGVRTGAGFTPRGDQQVMSIIPPADQDSTRRGPGHGLVRTVGHGDRASRELVDTLTGAGVEQVIDVRSHPGSRRFPRFDRSALTPVLEAAGIGYRWRGRELGGQRRASPSADAHHPALATAGMRAFAEWMESARFAEATAALEREAGARAIALLCAELDPRRCHRWLIADHLVLIRGLGVEHLQTPGQPPTAHRVSADARPVECVLRYDRGANATLDLGDPPA